MTAMPATPSNVEPDEARADLSRRVALKLSLAASGVLAAGGLVKFLNYEAAAGAPTALELEAPEAYPTGTARHLPEVGAWLLRDEGGLFAISTHCTHLGCAVERQADGFRCPCHGSRFAPDGQALNGPATRPLHYLRLSLSGLGRVVLHTDQVVAATVRL